MTRSMRRVRGKQPCWRSGDGLTLAVLAPSMSFLSETGDDVNENSIVVMLRTDRLDEPFMSKRSSRFGYD